ncbi:MAG TPA: GNAT family N-acyltransferase [Terriglobales bacterium]|nr:GNAT family N-acyltransferase [Terriglobales bacterium]
MPNPGLLAGQNSPPIQAPDLFPFRELVEKFLPMSRIRELYQRAQQPINRSLLENVLTEMRVECKVAESDIARIPTSGAAIVTSNHPFGILDGVVVGALLSRVREDVKILTNFVLAGIPELREHCIFVDPFGGKEATSCNRRGLADAVRWLKAGGMLAVFPAGEVSHFQFPKMNVVDPEWSGTPARLACLTGANTVPLFIDGRNSVPFQAMGLLHPKLRTVWLLNEFLQQTDRSVSLRIGNTISAEALRNAGHEEATQYVRWRTYLLAERGRVKKPLAPALRTVLPVKPQEPVADAVPQELLQKDIAQLPANSLIDENREFAVYVATADAMPNLLQELGRLREVTFRIAGEGTGERTDIDRFDFHYKHLLLWSKNNQELVGAYRMGHTKEILPAYGSDGLYTSTLFRYDRRVFNDLGPALELGRSFVRVEYQRQYAPLLMLWKGIGRYLAKHPELAVLFGAVSVSSRYNQVSRELIVRFFQAREKQHKLARWITPRRPFRQSWIRAKDYEAACSNIRDIDELSGPISDVETDGKGLPILLKQYAKLGGRIVSFNVDKKFSDVLDGLVLVDLRQTEGNVLEKYMGKDGLKAFRQYHGIV